MDASHIFLSIRNTTFLGFHGLHHISPPPPAYTKDIVYVHKIAKDQYVCKATQCTNNNNFNHDTGPHVYERFRW
jgi:hypothetical protein